MTAREGVAMTPDTELVAELRAGSSAALGELFDRFADPVYNYCFRRVGSWDLAEDLVSTVFLEVWRIRERAEAYDGDARPWLYGVATNVCRNATRSRRRHLHAVDRLPRETTPDHADHVADAVDTERRVRDLHRALQQLNERDRDVLLLVVWSGLSYEQAARALAVPVGTVRSRLARAKRHLAVAAEGAS